MEQTPEEASEASPQTTLFSHLPEEDPTVSDLTLTAYGRREALFALLTGAAYLLFWALVHRIPSGAMPVLAITTLLSLFLVLLFTVRLARAIRSPQAVALNVVLSFLVVLPSIVIPLLVRLTPTWPGWGRLAPSWHTYLTLFHRTIHGLDTLLLIWLAACLGIVLSRLVKEFKLLLPMGVALAMVDIWTVLGGGVVETAASGKSQIAKAAMSALTVQLPTTQPSGGAAPFPLLVGFADFLFIALFFACFQRFGIPSRRIFPVLFVTLFCYMAVVFLFGFSLPALVPIAVVVIGMNWRRFRYERTEAFALLYAGILLSAALLFLFWRSRHG